MTAGIHPSNCRRIAVIVAAAAVIMCLSAPASWTEDEPLRLGRIAAIYGEGTSRWNASGSQDAHEGTSIFTGDLIRTGPNAEPVNLLFDDGTVIVLSGSTQLKIESAKADNKASPAKVYRFQLIRGRIQIRNHASKCASIVETEAGVVHAFGYLDIQFMDGFIDAFSDSSLTLNGLKRNYQTADGQGIMISPAGNAEITSGRPPALLKTLYPWGSDESLKDRHATANVVVTREGDHLIFQATEIDLPSGKRFFFVRWELVTGNIAPVASLVGPALKVKAYPGPLEVLCYVDDGLGGQAKPIRLSIRADRSNEPPALAMYGPLLCEPGTINYKLSASDPDDDPFSVHWQVTPVESAEVIEGTRTGCTVRFSKPGTYFLEVISTDIWGAQTRKGTPVNVVENNEAPIIPKQEAITVEVNAPVELIPKGARDPEGQLLTFRFRALRTAPNPPWPAPDLPEIGPASSPSIRLSEPGQYVFELVANDGEKDSKPAELVVVVKHFEGAPRIVADDEIAAEIGKEVIIDASRSYGRHEPHPDISIRFVSGPSCRLSSCGHSRASFVPAFAGTYRFRLAAEDEGGVSTKEVIVRAARPNTAPVVGIFSGPARGSVGEEASFVVGEASDNEDDPLEFKWAVSDSEGRQVASGYGQTYSFTPKQAGTFVVKLYADDGNATSAPAIRRFIAVKALSKPSLTIEVSPKEPRTNAKVTLSAARSRAAQGGALTFMWTQLAGPPIEISGAESVLASFTPAFAGRYSIRLTVSEENGRTASEDITLTVQQGNTPPVVAAAKVLWVRKGEEFSLDASGSYDPDGDKLSFEWELLSADNPWGKSRFGGASVSLIAEQEGFFRFHLGCTDGEALSDWLTEVRVWDGPNPHASIRPAAATVAPNDAVTFGCVVTEAEATFRWYQVRGTRIDMTTQGPVLTAKPVFPGIYEFACVVFSNGMFSPPAHCVLTVPPALGRREIEVFSPADATVRSEVRVAAAILGKTAGKVSFSWLQKGGPITDLTHSDDSRSDMVFIPSQVGTYDFTVTAEIDGISTSPKNVRIVVTSPVPPPYADAGSDLICETGGKVPLDGSQSKRPGGGPLKYSWKQLSGPPILNGIVEGKRIEIVPDKVGVAVFLLTIDNGYESASDEISIRIREPNAPPDAKLAVLPSPVYKGESVVIDASASRDPERDPLSYTFSVTRGGRTLKWPARSIPYLYLKECSEPFEVEVIVDDGYSFGRSARLKVNPLESSEPQQDEPLTIASSQPTTIFDLLTLCTRELGREFIASPTVLDIWPLERKIPPFSWQGPANGIPDFAAFTLGSFWHDSRKHADEWPEPHEWILLARSYEHLSDQRVVSSTDTVAGQTAELRVREIAQFCSRMLSPATRAQQFTVDNKGLLLYSQLPPRGKKILSDYIVKSAVINPTLPVPQLVWKWEPSLEKGSFYLDQSARTIGDLCTAMSKESRRCLVSHWSLGDPNGIPLGEEFRAQNCGGWVTISRIFSELRKYHPGIRIEPFNQDPLSSSGGFRLTSFSRAVLEGSSENVWDCGRLVVAQTPLPRPEERFSDIAEEIRSGNDILKVLWNRDDPAVFVGIDPIGRLVMYNSPKAIDYTLAYLWEKFEEEMAD
ncbi:MAG: hypothetical protein Kow00107_02660 [Planctomycetota bacterium]